MGFKKQFILIIFFSGFPISLFGMWHRPLRYAVLRTYQKLTAANVKKVVAKTSSFARQPLFKKTAGALSICTALAGCKYLLANKIGVPGLKIEAHVIERRKKEISIVRELESIANPALKNHRDLMMIFDFHGATNAGAAYFLYSALKSNIPVLFNKGTIFKYALKKYFESSDHKNWDIYSNDRFVLMIPSEYNHVKDDGAFNINSFMPTTWQQIIGNEILPPYYLGGNINQNFTSVANGYEILRVVSDLFNNNNSKLSWNFLMCGHGIHTTDLPLIGGIPTNIFKILLTFFNQKLNVNSVVIKSCYASSDYIRSLVYEKNIFDFPIINIGFDGGAVSEQYQYSNIDQLLGRFFDNDMFKYHSPQNYQLLLSFLHAADDRTCRYNSKLAQTLNPLVTNDGTMPQNRISIRPRGADHFIVPHKNY